MDRIDARQHMDGLVDTYWEHGGRPPDPIEIVGVGLFPVWLWPLMQSPTVVNPGRPSPSPCPFELLPARARGEGVEVDGESGKENKVRGMGGGKPPPRYPNSVCLPPFSHLSPIFSLFHPSPSPPLPSPFPIPLPLFPPSVSSLCGGFGFIFFFQHIQLHSFAGFWKKILEILKLINHAHTLSSPSLSFITANKTAAAADNDTIPARYCFSCLLDR